MWSLFSESFDDRTCEPIGRREAFRRTGLFTSAAATAAGFDLLWPRRGVLAADAAVEGPWGSVKGRVTWAAQEPAPTREAVDLTKFNLSPEDLAFFRSQGPLLAHDWVVDPKTKGVRYCFVWLIPDSEAADAKLAIHPSLEKPGERREVDQPCSGFTPHAIAVREGQELLVKNDSPISHAVQFSGPPGTPEVNRAMPPKTSFSVTDLKAMKYPVKLVCAPHPWEGAWLRIFDHPYFAVTDEQGDFEIPFAPAGKHRLVVWHETAGWRGGPAGRRGEPVTIEAGASLHVGEVGLRPRVKS